MLDLAKLQCPNCGFEQDCGVVVPLFGVSQVCIQCQLSTWLATWKKSDGSEVGPDEAELLRSTISTIRRPAVFVATYGADAFGGWVAIELERALYQERITTLHNANFLMRTQESAIRNICGYADHVVVVGDINEFRKLAWLDFAGADAEIKKKLVVVKRKNGTPSVDDEEPYEVFVLDGPERNEIGRLVFRIQTSLNMKAGIALPLPSTSVLGSIVEPINRNLIEEIANSPALLRQLGWRDVEKLIAEILAGLGHEVELQRGTKDGGIDVVAFRHGSTDDKILVQVKHPTSGRFVGVEPIQRLHFLRTEKHATKAILACTTGFSRGAKNLLEMYRWEVEGRDLEGILDWVGQYLKRLGLDKIMRNNPGI